MSSNSFINNSSNITGILMEVLYSSTGLRKALPEECSALIERSASAPKANVSSSNITAAKAKENSATKASFSLLFVEALIALRLM